MRKNGLTISMYNEITIVQEYIKYTFDNDDENECGWLQGFIKLDNTVNPVF